MCLFGVDLWMIFCCIMLLMIVFGIMGGWLFVFINSFDELMMLIFVMLL